MRWERLLPPPDTYLGHRLKSIVICKIQIFLRTEEANKPRNENTYRKRIRAQNSKPEKKFKTISDTNPEN